MIKSPFKLPISKNTILLVLSSVIVIYLLIHYIFVGVTTLPSEGDSVHMHIPIAKIILAGRIFHPTNSSLTYIYPASSELILAAFIALHIPLNLYNVFALVVLFFALMPLGQAFGLSKNSSLMLAFSLCSLYGILRYANTEKIDIWLLVFFAFSLLLLQKPEKKLSYFVKLGFTLGMVVGSKFSGPFYTLILLGFYAKDIMKVINIRRFLAFAVPFTVFGLIWYIRNIIEWGDPFYPQPFLFFKGDPQSVLYAWPYWKIAINFPGELLNALLSDYMVWVLAVVFVAGISIGNLLLKKFQRINPLRKLLLLGLINFVYFLFLPAPPIHNYTAIVFGIRYSFPALLTLMLTVFSIANMYKQNELLIIIAFANMSFLLLPFNYHAEFLFIYVSVITLLILFLTKLFQRNVSRKISILTTASKR